MNDTKPATHSLTIVSAAAILLVSLLRLAGVELEPGEEQTITASVTAVGTAIASLLVIRGRIRATKRISPS